MLFSWIHGVDIDSWYWQGLMVWTWTNGIDSTHGIDLTHGIESVLLNHTCMRGSSVARMRDFVYRSEKKTIQPKENPYFLIFWHIHLNRIFLKSSFEYTIGLYEGHWGPKFIKSRNYIQPLYFYQTRCSRGWSTNSLVIHSVILFLFWRVITALSHS